LAELRQERLEKSRMPRFAGGRLFIRRLLVHRRLV
jgi:hypothetical protein